MDEADKRKDQGMERRNHTGSGEDQQRKSGSFIRDGIEIFNYKNPATTVTFGIVAFVFFIITLTLMVDRRGRSEIEKIVIQTVPNVKLDSDGPTMRKLFQTIDQKFIETGYDIRECKKLEGKFQDLKDWIEAPLKSEVEAKKKKGHK